MAGPPKVFLDLEDTIIKRWDDAELINVQKIQAWLQKHNVEWIRIFSFAIWTDEDKQRFSNLLQLPIERALNVSILEWMSVEEMAMWSRHQTGLQWFDRTDFMQQRGKHGAFFDVCKATQKDAHCVLIDDAVPNETLACHDLNLKVDLVKMDEHALRWVASGHM